MYCHYLAKTQNKLVFYPCSGCSVAEDIPVALSRQPLGEQRDEPG